MYHQSDRNTRGDSKVALSSVVNERSHDGTCELTRRVHFLKHTFRKAVESKLLTEQGYWNQRDTKIQQHHIATIQQNFGPRELESTPAPLRALTNRYGHQRPILVLGDLSTLFLFEEKFLIVTEDGAPILVPSDS
jgi:hypothetical protein